jgi:hypothetical protein
MQGYVRITLIFGEDKLLDDLVHRLCAIIEDTILPLASHDDTKYRTSVNAGRLTLLTRCLLPQAQLAH